MNSSKEMALFECTPDTWIDNKSKTNANIIQLSSRNKKDTLWSCIFLLVYHVFSSYQLNGQSRNRISYDLECHHTYDMVWYDIMHFCAYQEPIASTRYLTEINALYCLVVLILCVQLIPEGWQTEYNQLRRKSTSVLCCKRIQAELQNYTCKDHLKWQQNKILLVRCAQVSKLFVCNGNWKHCHHRKK